MSSWFGGPSPSHRTSSHSHSHTHRTTNRETPRNSSPKGYFVRPHSPTRRTSGRGEPKGYFVRPKSPARSHSHHESERGVPSFLGLGGGGNGGNGGRSSPSAYSTASRGLFGMFGSSGKGSSSYYKRRPRDGYISKLVNTIRRLFRDLVRYARNNPVKLFMLVIMPLVTGGALHKILGTMGVRLPPGLSGMMGGGRKGYGRQEGGGGGGLDIGQVMNVAKMFI